MIRVLLSDQSDSGTNYTSGDSGSSGTGDIRGHRRSTSTTGQILYLIS